MRSYEFHLSVMLFMLSPCSCRLHARSRHLYSLYTILNTQVSFSAYMSLAGCRKMSLLLVPRNTQYLFCLGNESLLYYHRIFDYAKPQLDDE